MIIFNIVKAFCSCCLLERWVDGIENPKVVDDCVEINGDYLCPYHLKEASKALDKSINSRSKN